MTHDRVTHSPDRLSRHAHIHVSMFMYNSLQSYLPSEKDAHLHLAAPGFSPPFTEPLLRMVMLLNL